MVQGRSITIKQVTNALLQSTIKRMVRLTSEALKLFNSSCGGLVDGDPSI
jgi:hypothetical protein